MINLDDYLKVCLDDLRQRPMDKWLDEGRRVKDERRKNKVGGCDCFIHRMEAVLCSVYVTTRIDVVLRDNAMQQSWLAR